MNILELQNVSKTYTKGFLARRIAAVEELCFAIETPGITGFVGPNGAGKTTTIKMILGLVKPSRGKILIHGRSPRDPASRAKVAYVSEQPYFYQYLTIHETLTFMYRLQGLPPLAMKKKIDQTLARIGLGEASRKKVRECSKGMQQRLNMAQALLGDASLYVFDEPMSGMDPLGRKLFRKIMRELATEGKTVFFSTHILEDIEYLCDNVIALSGGKLSYDGPIAELLQRGDQGAEITTPRLPRDLTLALIERGYETLPAGPAATKIAACSARDLQTCQDFLAKQGIYPTAIKPRRTGLEKALYPSNRMEAL